MIRNSLIAAAAVAISVTGFSASQANAGTDVDIFFNVGVPLHGGNGYYPEYPIYDDYPHHSNNWGISCGEGKWTVKSAHFKKVKTVECEGKTYTYTGWKWGNKKQIKVSRKYGNIISVSNLW